MKMKIIFFKLTIVCLTLLVTEINCAQNKNSKIILNAKCSEENLKKIDGQLSTVIPILNGVKLPENEQQLRKYCTSVTNATKTVSEYTKICLGAFGPVVAKLVISDFDNEVKKICKSDQFSDKAQDLTIAGRCANKASTGLAKCGENFIEAITALPLASVTDRTLMGCCHVNTFRKCVQKTISKTDSCEKQSVDILNKFGSDVIGDSLSNYCGDYFYSSQKCKKYINKTPKLNAKPNERPKSIFQPLISLFESFRNVKCDKKTERKMDQFLSDMIVVGTDKSIPENEPQLREYCSKITQNFGFIYGYVDRCISDFGQVIAKLVIIPLQKQFNGICKPGRLTNKAKQMMKAGVCGNLARNNLRICNEKFVDAMVAIPLAPVKDRVSMVCCHSNVMRECFRSATLGRKGCDKSTIDWAEKWVLDIAGGTIDTFCGEYFGTNEKCNKLIAETPKMDPKTYVRPKSFFLPAIALMESFPDSDNL